MKTSHLITSLLAGSAFLGASFTAIAQEDGAPPPPPPPQKQMGKFGQKGHHGPGLKMFDTNKDGKITKAEIEEHQNKMFIEADTNKDGFVTAEEISAHHEAKMAEMRKKRMEEQQKRMLAELDTNKDGKISQAEFAAKPTPMFDKLDANSDGVVDDVEMKAMKDKYKGMKRKMRKFKGEKDKR